VVSGGFPFSIIIFLKSGLQVVPELCHKGGEKGYLEMAHVAHLYRVGETWYFRIRFPVDLKPFFKRDELKRTLRTKSLTSAKRLLKIWNAKTEKVFTLMRTGMLSDAQMKKLVEGYIKHTLAEHDSERLKKEGVRVGDRHISEDTVLETEDGPVRVSQRALFDPEAEHVKEELEKNQFDYVSQRLDEFLRKNNLEVDKGSVQYLQLCRDIALAHVNQIHQIDCQRDMGDFSDPYYHLSTSKEERQPFGVEGSPKGVLLSELIEKYVKEKSAQEKWTEKSKEQSTERLGLMLEVIGDRPAGSLTRDDVVDCLEKLKRIPRHRKKKPEYRDKTVRQLLSLETVSDPLGVTTVKHHMQLLSTLLRWAVCFASAGNGELPLLS